MIDIHLKQIFNSTDCNNPDHHHQTSTSRPVTRPTGHTTKSTVVFRPTSTPITWRPPTSSTNNPNNYQTQPSENTTPSQRPQTYPPRPSSTPNPTGSGSTDLGGNLGVQPPSIRPTTPNPNILVPGYQPQFFIIPYPFPIAPSCPCYGIEPAGNHSSQNQQQLQWQQAQQINQNSQLQWQSQSQYAIGFIPVLFVPHCSPSNHSQQFSGQFPIQVPYPCTQCNQSNRNGRELDLNENFSSSDSLKQVLALAGVDVFSNSLVKSPNRKRARKLKRIHTVEEPRMNELHNIAQKD